MAEVFFFRVQIIGGHLISIRKYQLIFASFSKLLLALQFLGVQHSASIHAILGNQITKNYTDSEQNDKFMNGPLPIF